MTQPLPPPDAARRELYLKLRRARQAARDPGAKLVPVEGGEPMPAEDPPVVDPEDSAF